MRHITEFTFITCMQIFTVRETQKMGFEGVQEKPGTCTVFVVQKFNLLGIFRWKLKYEK